jgi:3-ketosteroid 9alpha-monooxygenase subunit A
MSLEGWYQVAFEEQFAGPLMRATLGEHPLVLAQAKGGVRAFHGSCPHRGAHLAVGGRLEGNSIICPFHGYRIGLGESGEHGLCAREYPVLARGGLIFVRLSAGGGQGLESVLTALCQDHRVVPGFTMEVDAPPELITENAFDSAHFRSVHDIQNVPDLRTHTGPSGELVAEGVFRIPTNPEYWHRTGAGTIEVPYIARAFGPGIVISEVRTPSPYVVLTASTPSARGCTVRLSLAIPKGSAHRDADCRYLIEQSRLGLEKDCRIWEHLPSDHEPRFTPHDGAVQAFRHFCQDFRSESHGTRD